MNNENEVISGQNKRKIRFHQVNRVEIKYQESGQQDPRVQQIDAFQLFTMQYRMSCVEGTAF